MPAENDLCGTLEQIFVAVVRVGDPLNGAEVLYCDLTERFAVMLYVAAIYNFDRFLIRHKSDDLINRCLVRKSRCLRLNGGIVTVSIILLDVLRLRLNRLILLLLH